jgi:hypothetical protein
MPLNPFSYKPINRSRDLAKTLNLNSVVSIDSKERLGLNRVSIILPLKDFNDF